MSAAPLAARAVENTGRGVDGPLHVSPVMREPGTVAVQRTGWVSWESLIIF